MFSLLCQNFDGVNCYEQRAGCRVFLSNIFLNFLWRSKWNKYLNICRKKKYLEE